MLELYDCVEDQTLHIFTVEFVIVSLGRRLI